MQGSHLSASGAGSTVSESARPHIDGQGWGSWLALIGNLEVLGFRCLFGTSRGALPERNELVPPAWYGAVGPMEVRVSHPTYPRSD